MTEAGPLLNIFRGLPPGTIAPQSVRVDGLNGTGIEGQAANVAGALEAIGFVIDDVDSHHDSIGRTTDLYGAGEHAEALARRVARQIGRPSRGEAVGHRG